MRFRRNKNHVVLRGIRYLAYSTFGRRRVERRENTNSVVWVENRGFEELEKSKKGYFPLVTGFQVFTFAQTDS